MANFKQINYSKLLYDTLGNYLSITKVYFVNNVQFGGLLSNLYKFCLSCIYTLQSPMDDFHRWRVNKQLIANCKWQIGQLLNVLNYIFDPIDKRIYISQLRTVNLYVPTIQYESAIYTPTIDNESTVYAAVITETTTISTEVNIHVPSNVYNDTILYDQLVSTIEQVKITGINYIITEIL